MYFRFRVKCKAAWNYCARITRKRETSEDEAIVLEFDITVQQKENGVRTPGRRPRIEHCSARIYGRFIFPLKLPAQYFRNYSAEKNLSDF